MEIKDMSIEQIESHLEGRVKPRATLESAVNALAEDDGEHTWRQTLSSLDWTPPKQDFEIELVDGMPCIDPVRGFWEIRGYDSTRTKAIPFNRSLVGKAVE